ncbi:RibD family protein [Rhizobium leguminosarum]|uniref:dihydrofolate reductase family protein n=1 Tax=Rhizobium TaxID=379 RepID=UPI001031DDFC|nr:RibD family protein [Rhizobium leguminosarum]TBF87480.1 RibD family protein [Rhizobium leguminosarum]TBG06956.1 RibD family protein [Rhizobium leguminosarum]TBG07827.1 RibD family protein [Rhizobium leguminosarum]TBG29993.1 RibD family protein [Rhizobium leguminosarum]TBG50126.1 RibD family protein [Rhizobium leguminosarum]
MKPYVTLHMISSIDGRIEAGRWAGDAEAFDLFVRDYEEIHEALGATSWIVGRKTMQEFTPGPRIDTAEAGIVPRTTYNAAPGAQKFAIVVDPRGKLTWDRDNIKGDRIIEILTTQVSDHYLHHLRRVGVSYLFAGDDVVDIEQMLIELKRVFNIDSLLAEGGGVLNGSFVAAGAIDEISLLIAPVADGCADAPTLFEYTGPTFPATHLTLLNVERREGGLLWLRYRVAGKSKQPLAGVA